MTVNSRITAALALGALIATPARAETSAKALLKAIGDCRAMTQPDARLACFDTATAGLQRAVDQRDVTVLDREDVQKTRRSMFGFTMPRLALFGDHDKGDEELVALDGVIGSVRSVGYARLEITLDGGAVWQNIEPFRRDPKPGEKVHINKASLGSYFMRVGGTSGVRCIRVR